MKKRILSILLIGAMCVSLSGCGVFSLLKGAAKKEEASAASSPTPAASAQIDASDIDTSDSGDVAQAPEEAAAALERSNLVRGVKKVLFSQADYSLVEYFEAPEGQIIVGADASDDRAYVLTTENDSNFTADYIYYLRGQGDFDCYEIPEEYSVTTDLNHSIIHDGKLYFTYYEMLYDGNWSLCLCSLDGSNGSFTKDVKYTDLMRQAEENVPDGEFYHNNILYDLETNGCFYRHAGNSLYGFYSDNSFEELPYSDGYLESFNSIEIIEDGYALLMAYEYEDGCATAQNYYLMDLSTGAMSDFATIPGYNGLNAICIEDDFLYYYIRNDESMGYEPSYEYFKKNLKDASEPESVLLLEANRDYNESILWGCEGLAARVIDEQLYLLASPGDYMGWYRINTKDLDEAAKEGPVEYEIAYRKFGVINSYYESKESTVTTDNADTGSTEEIPVKYYESYYETFFFDDDYPNADNLNIALERINISTADNFAYTEDNAYTDIIENYDPEYADYMSAYSNCRMINSVEEIGNRYIQIGFGYYDYWGGAHGMGGNSYTLLDRDSADEVSFADLYPGDLESLKKLVTAYTVDDWKSDSERYYSYYDPSDSQGESDFRATVEESIMDINSLNIRYMEDGFQVLWDPYLLGPYSSGEIDIYIPYADAGIDINE